MVRRPRHPALQGLVEILWLSSPDEDRRPDRGPRERALPDGRAHLALRACGTPIDYADADGRPVTRIAGIAVGGPRARAYQRDTLRPVRSVGATFAPGGVPAVLGVPGHVLAEHHVPLVDLWPDADDLAARLHDADDADALDVLEAALAARLRPAPLHPAVTYALRHPGRSLGELARETGWSERWIRGRFHEAVGLAPSTWARVQRFQRAVRSAVAFPDRTWADHAFRAGYADQAHLSREFRAIAGIPPTGWRPLAPDAPNHVPVEEFRSVQGRSRRAG